MMSASYVPDLIVLDLGLPDADGLHFLKELRKDTVTPVIIYTQEVQKKIKLMPWMLGQMTILLNLLVLQNF